MFFLAMSYRYFFFNLPLVLRAILMTPLYWLVAVIPLVVWKKSGQTIASLGFTKAHPGQQILAGITLGLVMSIVLTLIPILTGFGEYVRNNKEYDQLWQFIYEFFYCIFGIGLAEEIVFRGICFGFARQIKKSDTFAIILSSVLFGLFHFISGEILQMICMVFVGALFCLTRKKIPGCTLLSLILAHGVYDALIVVFSNVFK